MIRIFIFCFFLSLHVFADCALTAPQSRRDNIPIDHVKCGDDDYLTGYVQSLLDMHYYEFQIRVIVVNRTAYLFHLPCFEPFAYCVCRFISDLPFICCVKRMCNPCQFIQELQACDAQLVENVINSSAYQSLCCPSFPKCRIGGVWLPQNTVLFAPLIADPRQPQNAAALRFNDNVIGKHVGAPSFGGDFIVYRWRDALWWHGDMDIGVQAGIFCVFDLDHVEACMVNTDFFVSLLLTYAYEKWSYRFRWWHLSCHLGDEFIICNPTHPRYNLSDEGVDFFASFQLNPAIRIYGGVGYIYSRDKEFPEKPFYVEAGTEIRVFGCRNFYDRVYVQPFLAMHFRSWEEHCYHLDQTYALGVEWSRIEGVGRKFRVFLEFHDGYSKEGQFVRERADYFAVKITYGF